MVLLTQAKNSEELFFSVSLQSADSVAHFSVFAAFNQNQRTLLMPQTWQSLPQLVLHSASFWSSF